MITAKVFLYNLFPYRHIIAGLKKLKPPSSHYYNVLTAGPGGISMPLHIIAAVSEGDGKDRLPGSNLTRSEIIENTGFNIRVSFERATIRWEKSEHLIGFDQYSLYIAGEKKGGGGFYPDRYELYISNLRPGTDYRLDLSDSSSRKSPISISFQTRSFSAEEKGRETKREIPAEGIQKALKEAAESAARIKEANNAIQRVLKQRHLFKSSKIVDAALAVLNIDGIKQEEALPIISELLDDFYPNNPKQRKAVVERIKKGSINFNLDGLE